MPKFPRHIARGFEPLNGNEIVRACAAALFQALSSQSELGLHLAYPKVEWKITCELSLAASPMESSTTTHFELSGDYTQHHKNEQGTEGEPVEVSSPFSIHAETETLVEEPDRIREELLGEEPREPLANPRANVAVAPTPAGVEANPERFLTPGTRATR